MSKPIVLRVATSCIFGAAILAAQSASARSIRFDPGNEANPGVTDPIWVSVLDPGFGDTIDLGFGFNFFGALADSVQINNSGEVLLKSGGTAGTTIGTLTSLGLGTESYQAAIAHQATNDPLASIQIGGVGVAVSDAFRATWLHTDTTGLRFQSQIALFALANGDSLIEFNFFDQGSGEGINLAGSDLAIGLISPLTGTGSNLGSLLAGSPCLTTFGQDHVDVDPALDVAECTGYYSAPGATAAALPDPFRTSQGGSVGNDFFADYRYLFRFPGTAPPPPPPPPPPTTQVPEPASGSLLVMGALALLLQRRRSRRA